MIMYENLTVYTIIDVMESLAYKVLHYEHPTWHSIPEEDIVELLKGEGIDAYVAED